MDTGDHGMLQTVIPFWSLFRPRLLFNAMRRPWRHCSQNAQGWFHPALLVRFDFAYSGVFAVPRLDFVLGSGGDCDASFSRRSSRRRAVFFSRIECSLARICLTVESS
ncbi:hypothetical protein RHSP_25244 [Rhizobium freirei PRF 81]|uniref:Uncharacterized protein n=1 Tax=Rhizobium freirei PRF 81 TaxID=363754 RepID=N6V8B6_9HYPH|nr:hypothetical protein RHSP_25244 [Rhizobium freirei PRF 81]